MKKMNKLRVVIGETYKRNVKSVSFIVMILGPFFLLGIMAVSGYFSSKVADSPAIAVVSENSEIRSAVVNGTKNKYDIKEKITTEKEAKKAVKQENIGGYLLVSDNNQELSAVFYTDTKGERIDTAAMVATLNQLQMNLTAVSLNLSSDDLGKLFTSVPFESQKISVNQKDDNKTMIMTVGAMAVAFFMWFIIYSYANVIATEVASEKGTRIMEVLLSSSTAKVQFFGKIIGVLLVCLTQMLLYGLMAGIAYYFVKDLSFVKSFFKFISIKELLRSLVGYNLIYFVLGVLGYSGLAALCGSLVSKAEDSVKAIQPVTYLSMVGLMIGIILGISSPENIIMTIASYVPFVSPFIMLYQIAAGVVSTGGIFLSIGISLAATILLLIFAAKLYSTNVLVYSEKGFVKSLQKSIVILKHEKN